MTPNPKKEPVTSLYNQAPELISDKMIELGEIIQKHKARGSNADALKFYEALYQTMYQSFMYMLDVQYIYEQNRILIYENNFLKKYNREIHNRLQEYETVSQLIASDRLQAVEQAVTDAIQKRAAQIAEEKEKQTINP